MNQGRIELIIGCMFSGKSTETIRLCKRFNSIKKKCLVIKHNTAYDEFYLLAGGNLQVSDGQMATPSENAKKSEIKRLFTSTLKENKDSRVVLNKFISQVA